MRGGKREGAGRKPKADEDRIRTLSINSLVSTFGSEEKAFEHIARLAKDSFPHLKLLFEYAYSKPVIRQATTLQMTEQPLFSEYSDKEIKDKIVEIADGYREGVDPCD